MTVDVTLLVGIIVVWLRRNAGLVVADVGTLWRVTELVDKALWVLGLEAEIDATADPFLRCLAAHDRPAVSHRPTGRGRATSGRHDGRRPRGRRPC